jgi:ABC-2 type transport system ATP-binding protein
VVADVLLEVQGVTKYYGDFLAVENVTFSARRGEVLGLLGANGSGKTTTMRIMTGYIPPTVGTVTVCGNDIAKAPLQVRAAIGYLPEPVPLYTDMRVRDYLAFSGRLHRLPSHRLKARIDEVLGLCRLEHYEKTFIGKLSKGYRQRVGIAQAILHEPAVLILDEPTNSIDPVQVIETRALIKDLSSERAVILSTHVLSEASMLCDRVAILHEGTLLTVDSVSNLAGVLDGGEVVEMDIAGPTSEVIGALSSLLGVQRVTHQSGFNYEIVTSGGPEVRASMVEAAGQRGWAVSRVSTMEAGLEEVFISLTKAADAH